MAITYWFVAEHTSAPTVAAARAAATVIERITDPTDYHEKILEKVNLMFGTLAIVSPYRLLSPEVYQPSVMIDKKGDKWYGRVMFTTANGKTATLMRVPGCGGPLQAVRWLYEKATARLEEVRTSAEKRYAFLELARGA